MFARVITATTEPDDLDDFVGFARSQLSSADRQPGFAGYYVLTDSRTGKVLVISLWETREQMDAVGAGRPDGIRAADAAATVLSSMNLETYEVTLHQP